jgi:hypothetical protein
MHLLLRTVGVLKNEAVRVAVRIEQEQHDFAARFRQAGGVDPMHDETPLFE